MDGDQLVGTVIGGFDGRRGMVYHLAVAPAHRRRGVASQLMEEVEKRLRAKGCIQCYLLVRPDNDDALKYYEAIGWGASDDIIFMKELDVKPVRVAILTVSDRSAEGTRPDASGPGAGS